MSDFSDIEWRIDSSQTDYATALAFMEERAAAIHAGTAPELIWLAEHPPVYTAGTSARDADLIDPDRFPVFHVGRGGQYTYHGPGQRMVYVMLDLGKRGRDVRRYVMALEAWIIAALEDFDVPAFTADGRVGVWTKAGGVEAKIAAIGVRIRRWVTFHGAAINVRPDLTHFDGIIPCGLPGYALTSLSALGREIGLTDIDAALQKGFPNFIAALEPDQAPA